MNQYRYWANRRPSEAQRRNELAKMLRSRRTDPVFRWYYLARLRTARAIAKDIAQTVFATGQSDPESGLAAILYR
jgi:hypothetical protein